MKTGKHCLSCPEILNESYGSGEDQCAVCLQKENDDLALRIARILRNTIGFDNQYARAQEIIKEVEKYLNE